MEKYKEIKWKNIKIGDTFLDDSKVIGIHDREIRDVYSIFYYDKKKKILSDMFGFIRNLEYKIETKVSDNHLLLVDLKDAPKEILEIVDFQLKDKQIPTVWNRHVYYENEDDMLKDDKGEELSNLTDLQKSEIEFEHSYQEKMEIVKADPAKVSDTKFWLEAKFIDQLVNLNVKLYSDGHLLHSKYVGKLKVFCVETDTHHYETNGLIHHNSVMLQNIIFHALTHGEDVKIAMVDLKRTEMAIWEEHKNVMYVANTVKEAREIVLLARRIMDKRNMEMQKLGLKDFMNYVPTKFTGEYRVAGRKFKAEDRIDILLPNGEEKNVSIAELEQYLIWE